MLASPIVASAPRWQGTLHRVSGLVILSGAAMMALGASTGFGCPFQGVGLACAGCGCGRALRLVVEAGPLEALRAQPVALPLMAIIVAIWVSSSSLNRFWTRRFEVNAVALWLVVSVANWTLQLFRVL